MKSLALALSFLACQACAGSFNYVCDLPVQREDGSSLLSNEIGGVIIRVVDGVGDDVVVVDDTDGVCAGTVDNIPAGNYFAEAYVYDTAGVQSDPTNQVAFTILGPDYAAPTVTLTVTPDSGGEAMTVNILASAQNRTGSGFNSVTVNIDIPAAAQDVYAFVGLDGNGNVNSVNYDGNAMSIKIDGDDGSGRESAVYVFDVSGRGAETIDVVANTSSNGKAMVVVAMGADGTLTERAVNNFDEGTSATISHTATSANGDTVVSFLNWNNVTSETDVDKDSSQTLINHAIQGTLVGVYQQSASSASEAVDFSKTGSQAYGVASISFYDDGGGATAGAVNESVDLSDSFSATATKPAALTETLSLSAQASATKQTLVSVLEALSVQDSLSAGATKSVSVSEQFALSDATDAIISIEAALSVGFSVGDAVSATAVLQASVTEQCSLVSSLLANCILNASVGETFSLGDQSSLGNIIAAAINEAFSVGDTATVQITVDGTITEAMSLSDSFANVATMNVNIADGVGLSSSIINTALLEAGITEAVVVDVTKTSTSISLTIQTPEGRTLVVSVDNRTLYVAAEDRTLTIH